MHTRMKRLTQVHHHIPPSPQNVTSYTISSLSARLPSTVRKYMKKCNNMGTSTSKNRNDKGEHEHGSTVAAVKDQSPVKKEAVQER